MKIQLPVLRCLWLFALAVSVLTAVPAAFAQGTTAFTYQGQLRDGGTNANGTYSMVFKLQDALIGGNQVGPTVTKASQFITNGQFNASLDFGDVFEGSARWLEITVEGNVLSPRTQLTPMPYALHASTATTLMSSTWNASVGNYADSDNVLLFKVDGAVVLGLSGGGVLVNTSLEATEFQSGDLTISGANGITLPANDRNRNISATPDGINIDGIKISENSGIIFPVSGGTRSITTQNQAIYIDGISIGSSQGIVLPAIDRSRSISASNQGVTVDDVVVGNGGIRLPYSNGTRTITANTTGIMVDGVSITAGDGIRFTAPNSSTASLTANNSGLYTPYGFASGGAISAVGNVSGVSFVATSDRNAKQDFADVNGREVLAKVLAMPIQTWNYKQDAGTRHIGPMAQDFYSAFQVGPDERHIATVDADGVALAAIQGLNEVVKEKDAEIAALKLRLENLEKTVSTLVRKQNEANR